MASSNSSPGMGFFQLLSPEVRSMIFSYLDRGDMTSLRATCSTLERVVPCNIHRVFISVNSLNIQVFRAIADSELHRHKITEISWKYYEALLRDQRKIMQSNADIEAFKYGLQRFTHLRRVTITPSTHGRQNQPLFRTPMIRSFPFDFVYPSPRPWPYTGFDIEYVDAPWVPNDGHSVEYAYEDCDCRFLSLTALHIKYRDKLCSCHVGKLSASVHDEYISNWRGFSLVTRALVECEQDHHVIELIIGGREIWTGVNCHVFDQKCQDDGKCWYIDPKDEFKKIFPLEIIFPFDQWPKLQHFGISNMLVTSSNLVSLLAVLPPLRSVELSNLGFAQGSWWELLHEMRTKLDWRMRPVEERPQVHMTVADLYFDDLEIGFYVDIDDTVASFMYGSGKNPFRKQPAQWLAAHGECIDNIPRGTVGTKRDFLDPHFSAPYEFAVEDR
ncbi:unnamed protein product [Fusarium graminearum]|nr:unnamed protein product [Fusarium graminearum]